MHYRHTTSEPIDMVPLGLDAYPRIEAKDLAKHIHDMHAKGT